MESSIRVSMGRLMAAVFVLLVLACGSAYAWDWQYADFTSTSGLVLWGSTGCAAVANDAYTGGANWLLFTPDQADGGSSRKGGAWRSSMSKTANGFVTEFGFKIVNSIGGMADGFCFSVQNNNNSYWAGNTGPSTKAVSVRFDTYANTGEPGWNFVAVRAKDASGVGGDLIQQDVTPLGITLYDGNLHTTRVEYGSGLMNVYIDGVAVISNLAMDLSDYGVLNGDGYSYIGFCASTGGLAESNYIADWGFTAGYVVPEPGCVAVMLVGLTGLLGIRRRSR